MSNNENTGRIFDATPRNRVVADASPSTIDTDAAPNPYVTCTHAHHVAFAHNMSMRALTGSLTAREFAEHIGMIVDAADTPPGQLRAVLREARERLTVLLMEISNAQQRHANQLAEIAAGQMQRVDAQQAPWIAEVSMARAVSADWRAQERMERELAQQNAAAQSSIQHAREMQRTAEARYKIEQARLRRSLTDTAFPRDQ